MACMTDINVAGYLRQMVCNLMLPTQGFFLNKFITHNNFR